MVAYCSRVLNIATLIIQWNQKYVIKVQVEHIFSAISYEQLDIVIKSFKQT